MERHRTTQKHGEHDEWREKPVRWPQSNGKGENRNHASESRDFDHAWRDNLPRPRRPLDARDPNHAVEHDSEENA
jgi:hypothetical protein